MLSSIKNIKLKSSSTHFFQHFHQFIETWIKVFAMTYLKMVTNREVKDLFLHHLIIRWLKCEKVFHCRCEIFWLRNGQRRRQQQTSRQRRRWMNERMKILSLNVFIQLFPFFNFSIIFPRIWVKLFKQQFFTFFLVLSCTSITGHRHRHHFNIAVLQQSELRFSSADDDDHNCTLSVHCWTNKWK